MAQYADRFTSVPIASQSKNIAAAGNLLVKTGPGVFVALNINTGVDTSTITVYDGIDATGVKLGKYSAAAAQQGQIPANLAFTTGLFVVMATEDSDVTVAFR